MARLSDIEVTADSTVLTKSKLVSRNKQYADLDLSLTLNPTFNDVFPILDIDAVKNAVKNLVLTNFNERPFQPMLGSNLRALLFEPADNFTIVSIKNEIKRVLEDHEPRVDNITIQVADLSDRNEYEVTIGFRVIALSEDIELTIYLKRIR